MNLNDNFDEIAIVHGGKIDWIKSPAAGVDRRMLDRMGGEVARATTIVRYKPDSYFPAHVHTGGEEFIVLDGVFSDEHGDFPEGAYIRNPPTSKHTPGSKDGCVIMVKLWQYDMSDRTHVRIDTNKMRYIAHPEIDNAHIMPLFDDGKEFVRLERYSAGADIDYTPSGGQEIFVLEGQFTAYDETFEKWSWLRLPIGEKLSIKAGPAGAKVWVKEGALNHYTSPPLV